MFYRMLLPRATRTNVQFVYIFTSYAINMNQAHPTTYPVLRVKILAVASWGFQCSRCRPIFACVRLCAKIVSNRLVT